MIAGTFCDEAQDINLSLQREATLRVAQHESSVGFFLYNTLFHQNFN